HAGASRARRGYALARRHCPITDQDGRRLNRVVVLRITGRSAQIENEKDLTAKPSFSLKCSTDFASGQRKKTLNEHSRPQRVESLKIVCVADGILSTGPRQSRSWLSVPL